MTHTARITRSRLQIPSSSARGRLTAIAAACALATLAIPAHAGHYVVHDETELAAAISMANGDGDPSATIGLAANITIINPFALPTATKSIDFLQNGFTLSASGVSMYYAGPGITLSFDGTVNGPDSQFKVGVGDVVLTGTGSSFINSINILEGGLRVQDGGQITFGNAIDGGLNVNGDDTHVTVAGAGSFMDARDGAVNVGSAVGSSLTISDGGQLRTTGSALFAALPGTNAALTVSGAGASLSSTGPVTVGLDGVATMTLSNGGQVVINGGAGVLNLGTGATGSGILSIGGALGAPATAAGTLQASQVQFGAGTNNAINLNHTDANYSFAPSIVGNGAVQHTGPGTTVLSGLNTYTGPTSVMTGTLRAGGLATLSPTSAYTVGAGATLDLAGFSHSMSAMDVSGTVSTVGATPGTTLTVNGLWRSTGGTLRLGTRLEADASVSDRLVLNGVGASTSGTTTLQVVNLGGLGAQTVGNGIEVVSAQGGAVTTAQTTRDAFALQNGQVTAGAYEYRLFAADATGNGENWYLRSTSLATGGAVTYQAQVPLLNALPEQLRHSGLVMVGTMHQRMGSERQGTAEQRESWVRVISTERDIAQGGVIAPASHTRFNGVQVGVDVASNVTWRAGLYLGQLEGNSRVSGFASGIQNNAVGGTDLRSRYMGVYATYRNASDLYADAVLQLGRHDYSLRPTAAAGGRADADSWLASLEVGRSIQIASNWQVEPQAQLIYQRLEVSNVQVANALAELDAKASWTARVGVRVKTSIPLSAGTLQPYGRVSVYRSSGGSDIATFGATGGSTSFATRIGGTSTEAAIGAVLEVNPNASVFAEVGRLWASGGDTRSSGGLNGSVGLRWRW